MRTTGSWMIASAAASLLLAGAGCAEGQGAQSTARPAPPPTAGTVVAQVGDRSITLDEVDKKALQVDAMEFRGMKLGQALYEARRQAIDQIVADALLEREAQKQGVSRESLLSSEVASKVKPLQEGDLDAWYRENASRVGGQPLEAIREPLRNLLTEQRRQEALSAYLSTLRGDTPVSVTLDPPRVAIQLASHDPSFGPAGAPVEIVEFSDFQ